MSAICPVCEKDMHVADGCIAEWLEYYQPAKVWVPFLKGTYGRIRYGDEKRMEPCSGMDHCPDCHALVGHLHHQGCDWEECPRCGRQLLACACNDNGLFCDVLPQDAVEQRSQKNA